MLAAAFTRSTDSALRRLIPSGSQSRRGSAKLARHRDLLEQLDAEAVSHAGQVVGDARGEINTVHPVVYKLRVFDVMLEERVDHSRDACLLLPGRRCQVYP